jgi:hypothetical protein
MRLTKISVTSMRFEAKVLASEVENISCQFRTKRMPRKAGI